MEKRGQQAFEDDDGYIWPIIHVSKNFNYAIKNIIQFTVEDARFKYVCFEYFENGIDIYASTKKEHKVMLRFLEVRRIPTISTIRNDSLLRSENTEVHKPTKSTLISFDKHSNENIPVITVSQKRNFKTVQFLNDAGFGDFSVENYKSFRHIYPKTKNEFNNIIEFLQRKAIKFYIWVHKQLSSIPSNSIEDQLVIIVSKKFKSKMSDILVDGGFQNFCLDFLKGGVHIRTETMEEHSEIVNYLKHKDISCRVPTYLIDVKTPLQIESNAPMEKDPAVNKVLCEFPFEHLCIEKLYSCNRQLRGILSNLFLNQYSHIQKRDGDPPAITVSNKYKFSIGEILCDGGFQNFCLEFVKRRGVHIYSDTVEDYFALLKYLDHKGIQTRKTGNLPVCPTQVGTNYVSLIGKSAEVKSSSKKESEGRSRGIKSSSEKEGDKDPPTITVHQRKASGIRQILKEGGFANFILENIKGGVLIYSETMKNFSNIVKYLNVKNIPYQTPLLQQSLTPNFNCTFNPTLLEIKKKKIITLSDEFNTTTSVQLLRKGGFKNYSVQKFFDCVRIFPESLQQYSNILKYFHKNAIKFHTFAQKGRRSYNKFLIFGIDDEEPIHTVSKALSIIPGIIDIRRLRKSSSDGNRYEISEILVTTQLGTKTEDFMKLKTIGSMVFRVEVYNEKRFLPQCFRCQKYGHTKNYCCEKIACVRCSGPHYISECPRTGEPKCFHCNGPHVASYHLCPQRLKLESKMTMTKKTRKT